jgi:hypothetical protein
MSGMVLAPRSKNHLALAIPDWRLIDNGPVLKVLDRLARRSHDPTVGQNATFDINEVGHLVAKGQEGCACIQRPGFAASPINDLSQLG